MEESLNKAAELINQISATWPEKDYRRVHVLDALIHLTLENSEQAEEGFSNRELLEWVSKNRKFWGCSTDGEISSKVTAEWRKLEKLWKQKETGVIQRLTEIGINTKPELKLVSSVGGGHISKYSLTLEQINNNNHSDDAIEKRNSDELRYFEDDVDELKGAAKVFSSGFLLTGIRKWLFLGVMLLVALNIIVLIFVFSLGIAEQESFGQVIRFIGAFVFILWVEWSLFGAFYQVIDLRVQVAPRWAQPWSSNGDWLLVFEKNKPAAPNIIKLKRYTAKCSICGGLVRIHKGGFTNPGRLVGRCENSPREHMFSFDHYLRVGLGLSNRKHSS